MKLRALALSAALLLPAHAVLAQHHGPRIQIGHHDNDDSPARPGPRHSPREARAYITTSDDVATLLLTRDVLAMQLTERTLQRIAREAGDEDDDDGFFGRLVANVVRSSLTSVLRHSIQVPIEDIRSVDYRGGRILIVTEEGDRIFDEVEVNDSDVMEHFSRRDAEAFVREFRALKARSRAH